MNNSKYTPEEPIAAVATAIAPAALGIVRTSGKGCIELVAGLFSRPKALLEAKGNTIVHGWIKDKKGSKIDEVLASVFREPRSFTGEDMAEICCHGGAAAVTAILKLFLANGFRLACPGEYTFRAYINGKVDLTRAEAVREIISSRTDMSREKAAGRLSGGLEAEIESIKKLVVDTLASIEAEVEYPEDENAIADAFDPSELECAQKRLQSLCDSWKSEKLYQDGVRVVLCGKTNAGKSSLFNALLKEDRAIVSSVPGTTRDWLESWANFDGVPVRLFDTAGLRESEDGVEKAGVERARNLVQEADVIVYVADIANPLDDEDISFIKGLKVPAVLAWNKSDTLQKGCSAPLFLHSASVRVSALKGDGIASLVSAVKHSAVFDLEGNEKIAVGSGRQAVQVQEALSCVKNALKASKDGYTLDSVIQDLEDCISSLGEITGEVTSEDVLDSIFSRFCVGK